MVWTRGNVRFHPDKVVDGKVQFKRLDPKSPGAGKLKKQFCMATEPNFGNELEVLANKLKGQWSKADILRLGFQRLQEDVDKIPHRAPLVRMDGSEV